MEKNELYHHGIMGQKWGIRRYQSKDGSLTPAGQKRYNKETEKLKKETAKVKAAEQIAANRKKTQAKIDRLNAKKQELEERKKALKEEKHGKKKVVAPDETPEQRKERLLKSTDPKELYKYKDELSTFELNERINRIDTENRLHSKIADDHKKSGMEYMDNARNRIDKTTNLFRSVDNAFSTVANSAIGKTLAKNLGIELPKKEFNLEKTWANRNKLSTQEMMDLNKRLTAENNAKKIRDEWAKDEAERKAAESAKNLAKAQKEVDDYIATLNKENKSANYNMSGDEILDRKVATGKAKVTALLEDYTGDKQLPAVIDVEFKEVK